MRHSWDYIWTQFALMISGRSADPKHKVGCVIVSEDNTQVFAVGYNGDQKGGPNLRESEETGKSGFIHAEINALIKCDYNTSKNKKMYLTLSPCCVCAKAIINAGIKEVVYLEKYIDTEGIDILQSYGISVRSN
jgi:dCMP deaminase